MGTYSYYGDAASGAQPSHLFFNKDVTFKRVLKAADIIASDATMTAAGKIAAGDIIQALQVPANFVFLGSALKTVTPKGAAGTADIGVAGADEIQDGVDMNATAGTIALTLVGDEWGGTAYMGHAFTAADTIDVKFVNDTDAGEWVLYVWGKILD